MDSLPSPSPGFVRPLITQISEAQLCKGTEQKSVQPFARGGGHLISPWRRGLSISLAEGAAQGELPLGLGRCGSPLPFWGHKVEALGESGKRCWVTSLSSLPPAPAVASQQGRSSRGTGFGRAHRDPTAPGKHRPREAGAGAEHCKNHRAQVKSHP